MNTNQLLNPPTEKALAEAVPAPGHRAGLVPKRGTKTPAQAATDVITLALDLATNLGWALMLRGKVTRSGTLLLATQEELETQRKDGRERRLDIRFCRLLRFLRARLETGARRIVFEDVQFATSQCQAQLWASLRSAIWTVAALQRPPIEVYCVPVAVLKQFAAGKGSADKDDMARALHAAEPGRYQLLPPARLVRKNGTVMDDNEVDAIWLARFAAAVDRGEQRYLSAHERDGLERAKRRAQRRKAKEEKRARNAEKKAKARAAKRALREAIRATGKCCGVWRKPALFGRAKCVKCGKLVILHQQAEQQGCRDNRTMDL